MVADAADPKPVLDLDVEGLMRSEAGHGRGAYAAADELGLGGDFAAQDPVERTENAEILHDSR